MEPEDRVIRVYGPPPGEDATAAFTGFGGENLKNLIRVHKANRS